MLSLRFVAIAAATVLPFFCSTADAFVGSSQKYLAALESASSNKTNKSQIQSTAVSTSNDELDQLRREIEELRKEARIRIDEVAVKADSILPPLGDAGVVERQKSEASIDTRSSGGSGMKRPSYSRKSKIDVTETVHASAKALHDTYWKIGLDIGRERGTWMPEAWGQSGQRLNVQLEIQFCSDYVTSDREDFLGDRGGNLVRVVDNDGMFGPSMSESAKRVRFRDGAWAIAWGEGPAGSDLLRLYVELEERVERNDVYCPAGRIYLTCGYFDVAHRGHSRKRDLEARISDLSNEHNEILDQLNNEGIFSFKRFECFSALQEKKAEIEKTSEKHTRMQIMEPDLDLLRLSKKRDIGITKEGGICCKVKKRKGYYEYHILGELFFKGDTTRTRSPSLPVPR